MDRAAALTVLGVTEDTKPEAVRDRYLVLLRRHHPDVATERGEVDAALVTEAYRVVRATSAVASCTVEPAAGRVPVAVDSDTVAVGLPPEETFLALLDVAASIGSVTYVDRESGLMEVLVELTSAVICSVVISLQGRATGQTDAFCTVEAVTGGIAPRAELIAMELAELLDRSLNS